jgi:hypothetical protein
MREHQLITGFAATKRRLDRHFIGHTFIYQEVFNTPEAAQFTMAVHVHDSARRHRAE